MTQTPFRRKSIRLPLDLYRGVRAYSVTVRALGRPFVDQRLVAPCVVQLRDAAAKHGFSVFAYCFMPDHVHLLVAGTRKDSFLPDFMKDFKGASGYHEWLATDRGLWQKTYYDHVLRGEEDMVAVARYIAANPVRAGIVPVAEDYPCTGSFVLHPDALFAC